MAVKFTLSLCLILAGVAHALTATAASEPDSAPRQITTCGVCHGATGNGNGNDQTIPRLSSQELDYLKKQMRDFQKGERSGCAGMSTRTGYLSDAKISAIALFYAQQTRAPRPHAVTNNALGEKLYFKGDRSSRFIPACTGCHGQTGAGRAHWKEVMKIPPAIVPASVGGQPQVYVIKQLNAFKSGARANDAGAVMRHVAEKLTDEEITALSAFIAERLH